MMESPYKNILRMPVPAEPLVKHWSPVRRVPKAYDPYWNPVEWENIEADIYMGEGLLAQIKAPEPQTLKVEDLYEFWPKECWDLLDELLSDRPDLHDRIEKYKKTRHESN